MSTKKYPTQHPGVRYRKHPKRKYNNKLDQYFSIRYRVNGKLKEEGIGWASNGWNATKASHILAELKKAHLNGEGPQTLAEKRTFEQESRLAIEAEKEKLKKEKISFSEYFQETYFPVAKANKTKQSYKREETLFRLWLTPVIGNLPFQDIHPFHMERIKKNMADAKRSPRSIHYALAVVRQVFNQAIRDGIFSGKSPTLNVRKPKVDNRRMRFLTSEESDILLADLSRRSRQLHDMALLSVNSGLRAGEIFNLTWGCIDFQDETILVLDPKNGKNRFVPMTSKVKKMFEERIQELQDKTEGRHNVLVFKNRQGTRIEEVSNAFSRAIEGIGFNNGIDDRRLKVTFHTLRHTYASWLVKSGADLYTVSKLMGHSTIAMTERYSHLAPDTLKKAVKNLEDSLTKEPTEILMILKGDEC